MVLSDDIRMALSRVLWIGGAQWAGKTSVMQFLAVRYPLLCYAYDYHDARSHAERSLAHPERYPARQRFMTALDRDPDDVWVRPSPEEMAADTMASFAERFEMVIEDLLAMPAGPPILAEGWGLRPDDLAPLLDSPDKAIFLVPTEEFRQHQIRTLPRAGQLGGARLSDPDRAQRNRVARDRLLAEDVAESARRHGLTVVMVDGSQGVDGLVGIVEQQFRPFLPRWLYGGRGTRNDG
jgi:hypothetical protein